MKFIESKLLLSKLREFFPLLENKEDELSKAYYKVITFYSEEFCKNLKKIRLEKQFSQKEIVKILNITPTSYSAWETGSHLPKIDFIKSISDILGVDPSVFITFDKNSIISSSKKVPIIDQSYFRNSDFNSFEKLVREFSKDVYLASRYETVAVENRIDFLFDLVSDDMKSLNGGIQPYSLISCSLVQFETKKKEDLIKIVDGKVVVLSLCKGPGILRQVLCDGQYMILRAWNEKVADKRVIINGTKKKSDDLTLDDVVIFATTEREIRNVANIVH